jgi:hypothetical protein
LLVVIGYLETVWRRYASILLVGNAHWQLGLYLTG